MTFYNVQLTYYTVQLHGQILYTADTYEEASEEVYRLWVEKGFNYPVHVVEIYE
jgi:hypothetical protein